MIKNESAIYETVLINENNAHIVGVVSELPVDGMFWVKVVRPSGIEDNIRCKLSLDSFELMLGDRVEIFGKLRSYRWQVGAKDRLYMYIETDTIDIVNDDREDINDIIINGYLSKDGILRRTPLGKDIMDFFLVLQTETLKNGKLIEDVIPCICWGANALRGKYFAKRNTLARVVGRLQERHYKKQTEEGEVDVLIHELSASGVFYDEDTPL